MRHRSNLSKTLDYVRNLKTGNHGIFFYENPQEKHKVLFNFLEAGLEKDEGAIYIASQETSKQIRRHMEDFGLNVRALEGDMGVLRIFDYDGWYIINGDVNTEHTMTLGQRVLDEILELGLKGLRGCGEAACFFEHKKEKELVDYELMLDRRFDLHARTRAKLPLTLLCAYDVNHAKSLEEKLFLNLIMAHGSVVTSNFKRQAEFENLFPTVMDEVLETVFGEVGKETILRILEERHSRKPYKNGEDSKSFFESLEELVGSGAQVITKSVVAEMHSKMGMTESEANVGKR